MRLEQVVDAATLARLLRTHPGVDLDSIRLNTFPPGLRLGGWLKGITIGRAVWVDARTFADRAQLAELLAHELAHVRQWRERGPLGFLVRYWIDYLTARARGRSHQDAYEAIPDEVEARLAVRSFRGTHPE